MTDWDREIGEVYLIKFGRFALCTPASHFDCRFLYDICVIRVDFTIDVGKSNPDPNDVFKCILFPDEPVDPLIDEYLKTNCHLNAGHFVEKYIDTIELEGY